MKVALYTSGHGLGHFTRSVEVARAFVARGHHVVAISALKPELWTSYCEGLPGKMEVRQALIDGGAVQAGPLHVDPVKTLEGYAQTAATVKVEDEARWLKESGFHAVLTDATPIACTAAKLAGIPSVPVVNFTWDLMYAAHAKQVGEASDGPYHRMIQQISRHYADATLCIRLPGFSPMPAFKHMVDGPLVVRKARKTREQMRKELGLSPDQKIILITFGGHGSYFSIEQKSLPPGWSGLCVGAPGDKFPEGFQGIELGAYHFPDLVNAVDCVLGKLGYGMISECLSHGVPLIYVPRSNWMEEPFFRTYVDLMHCGFEMPFEDFAAGKWEPYLNRASQTDIQYKGSTDAGEVAVIVEKLVAAGGDPEKAGLDLAPGRDARLLDRTYWNFMLSPGANTDFNALDVPSWYLRQGPTAAACPDGGRAQTNGASSSSKTDYSWQRYKVVEGSERELEDVKEFLNSFGKLADSRWDSSVELTEEERKASEIFSFSQEIIVARAPGRLDVMGGIADYSGSLVLQMPLREACLCALQMSPASPHLAVAAAPVPSLRVVSFGTAQNHRGSSYFELPLSKLVDPKTGAPIGYEEARSTLFTPENHWAAYVAGCLLVLMREERQQLPQTDVNILIESRVTEGKGFSSSASVEVATMQALVAALGLKIHGRRLGVLCQICENQVVGAPCGIMDQLASTLGEENSLLALLCQPAEVKGQVKVPEHVAFWGIDSGVRHAVSGADYGSVRVAAFQGLKIIQSQPPFSESASPAYLTRIPVSEFSMRHAESLPAAMKGAEFTELFGEHLDSVTKVDPERTYFIRQCAAHPVHEHERVRTFQQLLSTLSEESALSAAAAGAAAPSYKSLAAIESYRRSQMELLGELMLQSHASYSRCGLGSLATDVLVELVLEDAREEAARGQERSLYGGKITGGGSGGTVCVMGKAGKQGEAALQRVVERYKRIMKFKAEPYVFRSSGPGSSQFGTLRVLVAD